MVSAASALRSAVLVLGLALAASASFSNVCTNGKAVSKLGYKEYMAEFAKGPCAPVVLLPGIMGSVLQVKINCAQLRASDPTTFGVCGWTTCPGEEGHSLENSPYPEYQIWVPNLISPMTIVSPTTNSKLCFGNLIQVNTDSSSGKLKPVDKPGVTFSVKGFTPQTDSFQNSECGTTSVEDLVDLLIVPEGAQYFRTIINRFKDMGYRSGLTLQAAPYDFRLSVGFDWVSQNLGAMLKKLKQVTNKKAVILAHSLGNLKTAHALWGMSQQDKDDTIALYLAVAPPYMGATETISYNTCGSSDYFFKYLNAGLDMRTWKLSVGSFLSVFELCPTRTYLTQASQPWLQKLLRRIDYEQGKASDPVFPFLPTKDQVCYSKFNDRNCRSGLEVYDNYATYLGSPLTNANYRDWINQHSFSTISSKAWDVLDSRFETLPNLGVPIAMVFSQVLGTEGKYTFNVDPKTAWSQDRYCTSKEYSWTPWRGDGTVPSTAAVTAGIKWADEFLNKLPNAKPVKLVDVCSELNARGSPWDGTASTGERILTKVEYQGLPCDCDQSKMRHCDHESMLFLTQFVDYASVAAQTMQQTSVSPLIAGMTDQQIQELQSTCQILKTLHPTSANASEAEAEARTASE